MFIGIAIRASLLGAASPLALFSAGEPGVWLDPSDLTTMFVDRAGTTPVTAPGQSVGKRLDKSGRGNHAVATADASRGIYGIEPLGGRRNLLRYSDKFDDSSWGKSGVTATSAGDAWDITQGGWIRQYVLPHTGNGGKTFTASILVKPSGSTQSATIGLGDGGGSFQFPANATVTFATGVVTGGTASLQPDGFWKLTVSGTTLATETANGIWFYIYPSNGPLTIKAAQFELGSTATDYQKVVSQYEVTEAGKPTLHYVQYDGVDDGYVTPTITPGIDKAQVFAGVRKLSDAASAILLETSDNSDLNTGTIFVNAPGNAGANSYRFRSKGTLNAQGDFGAFALAPDTAVISGLGDISGDVATLRRNSMVVGNVSVDQGTGNFLAYPLYIGRRGGTTAPFNGRDYGLIVRFGANLDATTISATENWLNSKTGAF